MICLHVNFVHLDKYKTIVILLHAVIQFDQKHLVKMLSFFPACYLALKNHLSLCVYIYVWVFKFIPLVNLPVFMTIACGYCYYSSRVQWNKGYLQQFFCCPWLSYSVFLHMKLRSSFKNYKELCWDIYSNCFEFVHSFL